jgi:predicted Fe-S protein YdhL (DUF1289 family)
VSEPSVPSPCVRDCRLDPATGLCRGCLRTVGEIARWSGADDAERARILAAVAERRAGEDDRRQNAERRGPPLEGADRGVPADFS